MTFNRMKFKIGNERHSEAIQKELFKLDCGWHPKFSDDHQKLSELDANFLIVDGGKIHSTNDLGFFDRQDHKELSLYDLNKSALLDLTTNHAINVESPEHSAELQEKLFKIGCEWNSGDKEVFDYEENGLHISLTGKITAIFEYDRPSFAYLDSSYLDLLLGSGKRDFTIKHLESEIIRAIANGDDIQVNVMGTWVDVTTNNVLLSIANGFSYKLRSRVKDTTIYQWEIKFLHSNGFVITESYNSWEEAEESLKWHIDEKYFQIIQEPTLREYYIGNKEGHLLAKNMKFKVSSPKESEEIQENLFRLGAEWREIGKKVSYTDSSFLYLEGGVVCRGSCEDVFNDSGHCLMTLEDLSNLVREHPQADTLRSVANGEQIQVYSQLSKCWVDLQPNQVLRHIAQGSDAKYRTKPKTKVIEQWEYKYLSRTGAVVTSWEPSQKEAIESCEWHTEEFGRKIIQEPSLVEYEIEVIE